MEQSNASLIISRTLLITICITLLSACWPFTNKDSTDSPQEETIAPIASFNASVQEGKAPLVISFTDNSIAGTNEITSWSWDFGDGGVSSEQNPQYTFNSAGSFDISLTVTNSTGANATVQDATVVVIPADIQATITLADERGLPIEAASASSQSFSIQAQGYNDAKQLVIDLRPSENDGVVRIEKPGYMPAIVHLESITGASIHPITLLKRADKITFDSFDGATLIGADGASVTIAAESLVLPNGDKVTGEVDVYITPLNIEDPFQANAFPGAFFGQPLGNSPAADIISYGVVDITFMQGDSELQLQTDSLAEIDMPLYATIHPTGAAIQVGDSIPLWILDEDSGIWQQESLGIVYENPLSPKGLSMRAATSHFSTFNSDFYSGANGSGGSGGSSGNINYELCNISVVIIGAQLGEEITLEYSMTIAGWGLISRTRAFIFQNQNLSFELIKGITMDYKLNQGDKDANESVRCSSSEDFKTITLVLAEKEPEFISWLTQVEPVFTKNSNTDLYEISSNTVLIGADFIGTTSGDISTELINHPLSLPPEQRFEALFESTDTNPAVINITLSNEFGSVEESTTVNYLTSQSPSIGHFYANPIDSGTNISFSWQVEGADDLSIYYLGEDPNSIGTVVFRLSGADIDKGKIDNNQLAGLKGYLRVEFSNQYGNSPIIGKLGSLICRANSDQCSQPQ